MKQDFTAEDAEDAEKTIEMKSFNLNLSDFLSAPSAFSAVKCFYPTLTPTSTS